jgi:hypothetical protein
MRLWGSAPKQIEEKTRAPEVAPAPAPEPPKPPPRAPYGISDAIELMRKMPLDQNPELIVVVIKTTLESMKVKVPDIIEDGTRRQMEIENRIGLLRQQIVDLELEILTRRDEIARLEQDYAETTYVKGRLELAEQLQGITREVHEAEVQEVELDLDEGREEGA